MFDLGWSELLVIAVVAILVVGPRDLPRLLRNVGKFVGQMRRMANDFQRQFNEALKEAELDEVKKDIESVRSAASKATAGGVAAGINPMKAAAEGIKDAVEKPTASAADAVSEASETETAPPQSDADEPQPKETAAPVESEEPVAKAAS